MNENLNEVLEIENNSSRTQQQNSTFSDFLTFRKMLAPVILQVIFWIGVVILIFVSIAMMAEPRNFGLPGDAGFAGFVLLILGPFLLRMHFELLIVFFRINETLTDIKNQMNS